MVRSASSGLKVAARLSPPDSIKIRSSWGNLSRISTMAARLMEASSRMAVCGQRASPGEDQRVLLGVNVLGDGADVVVVAKRLAERLHQRRLARADWTADADAQWAVGRDRHGVRP